MKKFAITLVMTLGGFAAYAADSADTPDQNPEQGMPGMPTAKCTPCPHAMQCDGTAWVDVEAITVEAENGDPIACYALAYITENGLSGVEKNADKAQELYRQAVPGLEKAAQAGHPVACRALARMYAEGKGVQQDETKAGQYMQQCVQACKKGAPRHRCGHHRCVNDRPADSSSDTPPAEM